MNRSNNDTLVNPVKKNGQNQNIDILLIIGKKRILRRFRIT